MEKTIARSVGTTSFPTSSTAIGGTPVDGSASGNQAILGVSNEPIANWPPGAALWFVWEMNDSTGRAQGLGIDSMSFSASDQPVSGFDPDITFQLSGTNLALSWQSILGKSYQVEFTDDLKSGVWLSLGGPMTGTGGVLSVSTSVSAENQRFYRLSVLP